MNRLGLDRRDIAKVLVLSVGVVASVLLAGQVVSRIGESYLGATLVALLWGGGIVLSYRSFEAIAFTDNEGVFERFTDWLETEDNSGPLGMVIGGTFAFLTGTQLMEFWFDVVVDMFYTVLPVEQHAYTWEFSSEVLAGVAGAVSIPLAGLGLGLMALGTFGIIVESLSEDSEDYEWFRELVEARRENVVEGSGDGERDYKY